MWLVAIFAGWYSGDEVGAPCIGICGGSSVSGNNSISQVLNLAHDRSGHFFWPYLKKDVSLHIRNCWETGKSNQVVKPASL